MNLSSWFEDKGVGIVFKHFPGILQFYKETLPISSEMMPEIVSVAESWRSCDGLVQWV